MRNTPSSSPSWKSSVSKKFVSEPLEPDRTTFDPLRMAAGEPGLPTRFYRHGRPVNIVRVLKSWRTTGPCRHGSDERYVRKHWYEVLTDSGAILTIYFERTSHSRAPHAKRWWLLSEETPDNGEDRHRLPRKRDGKE